MLGTNVAMNGNRKVERTPSAIADEQLEICSNCGKRVETNEWHPVVATDDTNDFRIHAFCGTTCRDSWEK